ncbi:MAG: sigma-70 family RNA polymerase sigma factor [Planctomycetes bacterium]|nr:sigma-70 family RNA polymerase sigma factor [Planctomycetota bacterium]
MTDAIRPSVESLYHSHARVVHGIAVAHVGPADADDVMQETFVLIQRGLDGVREPEALPGWICQVARNCAKDWLRRRARRNRHRDAGAIVEELGGSAAGDDGELAARVLAHVRSLPEAYRETLVLRLVEGLSGPEIAARTGLTHGSLRVNLCRGMAMLRPLLEKEGWP